MCYYVIVNLLIIIVTHYYYYTVIVDVRLSNTVLMNINLILQVRIRKLGLYQTPTGLTNPLIPVSLKVFGFQCISIRLESITDR